MKFPVVRGSQIVSDELLHIRLFNLLAPHESNDTFSTQSLRFNVDTIICDNHVS